MAMTILPPLAYRGVDGVEKSKALSSVGGVEIRDCEKDERINLYTDDGSTQCIRGIQNTLVVGESIS